MVQCPDCRATHVIPNGGVEKFRTNADRLDVLDQLQRQQTIMQPKLIKCQHHHTTPCAMFCLEKGCLKPLCPKCPIEDHNNHKVTALQGNVGDSEEIKWITEDAAKKQNELKALADEIESREDQVRAEAIASEEAIEKRVKTMVKELNMGAENLKMQVKTRAQQEMDKLKRMQESVSKCKEDVQEVLSNLNDLQDTPVANSIQSLEQAVAKHEDFTGFSRQMRQQGTSCKILRVELGMAEIHDLVGELEEFWLKGPVDPLSYRKPTHEQSEKPTAPRSDPPTLLPAQRPTLNRPKRVAQSHTRSQQESKKPTSPSTPHTDGENPTLPDPPSPPRLYPTLPPKGSPPPSDMEQEKRSNRSSPTHNTSPTKLDHDSGNPPDNDSPTRREKQSPPPPHRETQIPLKRSDSPTQPNQDRDNPLTREDNPTESDADSPAPPETSRPEPARGDSPTPSVPQNLAPTPGRKSPTPSCRSPEPRPSRPQSAVSRVYRVGRVIDSKSCVVS